MALPVTASGGACPSSPPAASPFNISSMMIAALAGECTINQHSRLDGVQHEFNDKDLIEIRNLTRSQGGAVSITLSPERSIRGTHHMVLLGQSHEHGPLAIRIGHHTGDGINWLWEAGFGPAFGLAAERVPGNRKVCLEDDSGDKQNISAQTSLAAAATINPKAAARNAACAAMHGSLGLGRLADVEGLPRMVGLGCCTATMRPGCTVPLFVTVSEQMRPYEDDPQTIESLGSAPRCKQMGWGRRQCHLRRLISSLAVFEQLTESGIHRVWFNDLVFRGNGPSYSTNVTTWKAPYPVREECQVLKPFQLCLRQWDGSLSICDTDSTPEATTPEGIDNWGCSQNWTDAFRPSTASYVTWLADWSGNCAGDRKRAEQVDRLGPRKANDHAHLMKNNAKIDILCSASYTLFTPLVRELPPLVSILADVQRRHDNAISLFLAFKMRDEPLVLPAKDRQWTFACLRAKLLELLPAAVTDDETEREGEP